MRWAILMVLVGCSFDLRPGSGTDGAVSGGDGSGGEQMPMGCGAWPQPPTGLDPCAIAPTGALDHCTASTVEYHTGTGLLGGQAGPASLLDTTRTPSVRIAAVDQLTVCVGATLKIVGPHPVVFVVHGAADVLGTIDGSAQLDGSSMWTSGPGAEIACGAGTGTSADAHSGGAGGGGGGGYGAIGGTGGTSEGAGGARGMTDGDASLIPLRGGCGGGAGGTGSGPGGVAGRGGGAIQIAVRDTLTISGHIRANGGPGEGGVANNGGGGGGGTGGALLLEAQAIAVTPTGAVCANGGGGGGGANDNGAGTGNNGTDGAPGTCTNTAAGGGPGAPGNGQRGGNGGFAATAAQNGVGADEGAGGGGGAVGRIKLRASVPPTVTGIITPPAQ